ncbi:MAG: hypothetical protein NZ561_08335, partial [Phycisphaerae bacterium]|nr:hypothetical protein [Phycisphaerae bacterium]MDW8262373.1 hypothetical protein [Phycisphaerales bacterium]
MSPRSIRLPAALLVCLMGVFGGCAGPRAGRPATLPAPPIEWLTSHFAGTPLAGPIRTAAVDESTAEGFELRLLLLTSPPPQVKEPLGSAADVIFSELGEDSVRATPRLMLYWRVATGAEAAAAVETVDRMPDSAKQTVASHAIALPRGVSFVGLSEARSQTDSPVLRLYVSRPPLETANKQDLVELAIEFSHPLRSNTGPGGALSNSASEPETQQRFELALLRVAVDQMPVVFLSPASYPGHPARFALFVLSKRPGSDIPAEALAACRNDLASALGENPRAPGPTAAARSAIASALEQAADPRKRRVALTFLATANQAPIATDVVMLADDALLEQFWQTL